MICSSLKLSGERKPLRGNWAIRESSPAADGGPPGEGDGAWLAMDEPATAAAVLRARGDWSLDGPVRDFDAGYWWYRVRFDAPPAAADERTVLGFDGLATIARVWLNGQALLDSGSMYEAHECDVTGSLEPTGNELLMRFGSVDAALRERRKRPRWRVPMLRQQQLRWLRTTLLGRTPGWSPPAAPVGPWRDVWIETRAARAPLDVRLDVSVSGRTGVVACRVELARGAAVEAMALRLERAGRAHVQPLRGEGDAFAGELRVPDAALWWPHTHGEPALYTARLQFGEGGPAHPGCTVGAIGFRTIEVDRAGGDFRVLVNGSPVFCRGACWMPLDPVSLRSSPDACQAALVQAREAGMNMLRIPGTSVYEEDHFYDACDELGLLVWQDFMFASMDYPQDDAAFCAAVEREATQQLRRLHAHPCLAVLCGNSEAEQQAAMWGAPREQWSQPLFSETLARLCATHAPHTPYWPSSAHGGAVPFQADTGTTSYYGVGAYLRPPSDARRCALKFATECLAFANVPGDGAIERMPGGRDLRVHHPGWKARVPRDLGAGWDFEDVRDHYLRSHFGVDPASLRHADHERYLALSRLVSGELMAGAYSEWRRPGSGCGGALVLMLRDLWPGAGWGVLDDAGSPKACYHALKRVLQPCTVLLTDEGGNGLSVHVVNEGPREASVRLELAAWRDGETEVASAARPLAVPARGGMTIPALQLLDHFMDLGYAYRFGPPPCDVVAATLRAEGGEQIAQAFHFPAGIPCSPLGDPGLGARVTGVREGRAELAVSTRRFAFGVHFDIPGFEPDDEYFHLAPGGQARVRLRGPSGMFPAGTVNAVNAPRAVAVAGAGAA